MSADSDNPFWDFSLVVYPRPGVAEACLALQDRRGLDVNLLLFCCWAGSLGWRLEAPDVARLTEEVAEWQRDVIGPLRRVRRRLKGPGNGATGDVAALRRAVKDSELEAERIEQAMLYTALDERPRASDEAADQAACAAANLSDYLELAGVKAGTADRAELKALLRGAFDGLTPEAAQRLLHR